MARSGGKRSKSVSSSAIMMLRCGRQPNTRRVRRFFFSLRIGRQHVARPFPDIAESVQHPPYRLVAKRLVQMLPQLIL
jgi:hypothetical protein